MIGYRIIALLLNAIVVIAEDIYYFDTFRQDENSSDIKEPRDRFRYMAANIDEQRVQDVIRDMTDYSCEKMIIVRNGAKEKIILNCSSEDDAPKKAIVVQPGKAFAFTFKARKDGKTKFWCTVEYSYRFVRFDVYNEASSYMCPREIDEVYQYTVKHDGVHVDEARGNGGQKIGALFKGHNSFILWEQFMNNETDGLLYSGLVDGGMCSDLPEQFNDKPKAVTVCYNHCIHLYEHFGCRGKVQVAQAHDDCMNFGISEELNGKLSAIKGC